MQRKYFAKIIRLTAKKSPGLDTNIVSLLSNTIDLNKYNLYSEMSLRANTNFFKMKLKIHFKSRNQDL